MHGPKVINILDNESHKKILRLTEQNIQTRLDLRKDYNVPNNVITVILGKGLELPVTCSVIKALKQEISLTNPKLLKPRHILLLVVETQTINLG